MKPKLSARNEILGPCCGLRVTIGNLGSSRTKEGIFEEEKGSTVMTIEVSKSSILAPKIE